MSEFEVRFGAPTITDWFDARGIDDPAIVAPVVAAHAALLSRAERAEKERDALAAALKQILRIDWERGIDWDTNTLMRSYLDAANAMQALARAALAQTGGDDD